jgi:iron(III) transport system permease protein
MRQPCGIAGARTPSNSIHRSDRPGRSASASFFPPLALAALVIAAWSRRRSVSVWANLFAGGTGDTWAHLASTVLPEYVAQHPRGCASGSAAGDLVGVGSAWLVTMHEFPGRALLRVGAGAAAGHAGLRDGLRLHRPAAVRRPGADLAARDLRLAARDYWFPGRAHAGRRGRHVQPVLYPYVYLLARTAFLERAAACSRSAARSAWAPWGSFFRISLPLARPAMAAGTALALMETLADYGTVAYFAVQTFTTGIYRAWFSLGDRIAAAQLSPRCWLRGAGAGARAR